MGTHHLLSQDQAEVAGPTAALGAWAAALGDRDIPSAVRERVVLLLLDTVASALAGRRSTQTAQVRVISVSV